MSEPVVQSNPEIWLGIGSKWASRPAGKGLAIMADKNLSSVEVTVVEDRYYLDTIKEYEREFGMSWIEFFARQEQDRDQNPKKDNWAFLCRTYLTELLAQEEENARGAPPGYEDDFNPRAQVYLGSVFCGGIVVGHESGEIHRGNRKCSAKLPPSRHSASLGKNHAPITRATGSVLLGGRFHLFPLRLRAPCF